MSAIHFSANEPSRIISSVEEAAEVLAPRAVSAELIGVEAEAFLVKSRTAEPARENGFIAVLTRYKELTGFGNFITEKKPAGREVVIGLTGGTGIHEGADITVEPGFQPEYGGKARSNLHQTSEALDAHLRDLARAAGGFGYRVVMPGLHPLFTGEEFPMIDKKRYGLMTEDTLNKFGVNGLTAMRGTTGVQYNLDTSSDNWERRYRTAFAIQPFVNALSGNSPFKGGVKTGNASERSVLWFENWGGNWSRDIAKVVLDEKFSLPKLTSYIAEHLHPPFFVRQGQHGEIRYARLGGKSFAELLRDRPRDLGDLTETDVTAMVGFAFLPVKPKTHGVIELRSADGSYPLRHAQGALAVGLLYDEKALQEAESLLSKLNAENYVQLSAAVNRSGLNAIVTSLGSVREIAQKLVSIAQDGLIRRGLGEEVYLQPLADIAAGFAPTPGEALVKRVERGESLAAAFLETAISVGDATLAPLRGYVPGGFANAAKLHHARA